MNVPLMFKYTDDGHILVVYNSKIEKVKSPSLPYIYSDSSLDRSDKEVTLTDIENSQKITVGKFQKTSEEEAKAYTVSLKQGARAFHVETIEQLLIDKPDFVTNYANTDDVKTMQFDIEVLSDGSGKFPKAETSPIVMIGYQMNDEEIQLLEWDGKSDKSLIENFAKIVNERDPDIMSGYNIIGFDIPYIIDRCMINNIDSTKFSRTTDKPYFYSRGRDKYAGIGGRVIFDIFKSVIRDQSLSGIVDKKMKTVAKWYDLDKIMTLDMEEISNLKSILGTQKLKDYLISDVRITKGLFDIYWPVKEILANSQNLPLDLVVNGYPSFIPKIVFGRKYKELSLVSLGNNSERYEKQDLVGKYEAAYVDILKNGFYPNVDKIDFKSQYPSCMLTFNLSPETVHLAGTAPFTPNRKDKTEGGEPRWTKVGDIIHFRFPDNMYMKDILIDVDLSKKGFAAEFIEELFDQRSKIKKNMARAKNDTTKKRLDSQQQAIKVLLNSLYGYCGQQRSDFGNLPVAIAIVQLSKWMIKKVVEYLGDRVVEIDTDGIILENYTEGEAEKANKYLTNIIKESFGIKSRMVLEPEEFVSGYFHKAKNYVLVEKDKRTGKNIVVKHGTAFKSSRLSTIYKKTLDKVLTPVLEGKTDLYDMYKEATNLDAYTLEDYKMRIRMNRDPKAYANPNSIYPRLAEQSTKYTGRSAETGDVLEFVVIKKGRERDYKLFEQATIDEIDKDYYLNEINKVFELFQVNTKEIGQLTLF